MNINRALNFAANLVTLTLVMGNAISTRAALLVNTIEPKVYGVKAILKMDLQNTFAQPIESVRTVVFLIDDNGKVVGQRTRWILSGTTAKPALAPNGKATFNLVVQGEKPFTKTKVLVTRIVLQDGKLGDPNKDVVIKTKGK